MHLYPTLHKELEPATDEGFHSPDPFKKLLLEIWHMSPVVNWIAHSSSPQSESHFNWFPSITLLTPQISHKDCTVWDHGPIRTQTLRLTHTILLRNDRVNANLLIEEEEMTLEEFSIQQLETENNCLTWLFSKRCSLVLLRHSFSIMVISHAQLPVVKMHGGKQKDCRREGWRGW